MPPPEPQTDAPSPSPIARQEYDALGARADLVEPQATTRAAFLAEARGGAFEGVRVIYRTFASFEATGGVDAEFLDALPSTLRFICHNGRLIFLSC